MQGEMAITYVLADAEDGTNLTGIHQNLPPGASQADNELGWSMSLDKRQDRPKPVAGHTQR